MKRLKDSTIARYSVLQLAKHLNKLMESASLKSDKPVLFRVDLPSCTIFKLCKRRNCYLFFCTIVEFSTPRALVTDAIQKSYTHYLGEKNV